MRIYIIIFWYHVKEMLPLGAILVDRLLGGNAHQNYTDGGGVISGS